MKLSINCYESCNCYDNHEQTILVLEGPTSDNPFTPTTTMRPQRPENPVEPEYPERPQRPEEPKRPKTPEETNRPERPPEGKISHIEIYDKMI